MARLLIPRAYVRPNGQIELVTDHPTPEGRSCFEENPNDPSLLLSPRRFRESLTGQCSLCLVSITIPLDYFYEQVVGCLIDCNGSKTIKDDHRTPQGASCTASGFDPHHYREFYTEHRLLTEGNLEIGSLGRCRKCKAPLINYCDLNYANV